MSFTLGSLLLFVGLVSLAVTVLILIFSKRSIKNILMSYLQNFVGVLFLVSGAVKAVDPLGTAYKMEQYFAEFESTFAGTWLDFMSGLFPKLAEVSIGFSVFMVVFELVLAFMLITGTRLKFTAYAFSILVVFFTVLTGFTYLTGYVPSGVNFFEFGAWDVYKESNMKVTDCGCFGDFIKLQPKVSFLKDVFLLIPGVLFILGTKQMHQLGTKRLRSLISFGSIPILLIYCFSNYVWDIPHVDFRPFKIGADVRTTKEAEMEAQASVQVTGYFLSKRDEGGKVVETAELSMEEYLKAYMNYPKEEGWTTEQITSKPSIIATKISDFELQDMDGNDGTDAILYREGYSLMLVAYKLDYDSESTTTIVNDSIFVMDTVQVTKDSVQINKVFEDIVQREEVNTTYSFPEKYMMDYKETATPFITAAQAAGIHCYEVVGLTETGMIEAFKKEAGIEMPFYMADDILLKTIVRSNPGFVLWKDGTIVHKWHINKLPSFEEVQSQFIK